MLTPDYLGSCADDIVALYEEYTRSIIAEMARRLAKMDYASPATVWQAEKLQEAGMLYGDITKQIAPLINRSEQEVSRLFKKAGTETLRYDDSVYKIAGLNPLPISQSQGMLDILLAGVQKTNGNMKNLTMTTAISSQTQFVQALDLAYMQVSSGSMDYGRAIVQAVKGLSQSGVTSISYLGSGKMVHHKVDTAVRRAVLTGVNQTAAQMQLNRMDDLGWNDVEVTAHFGARPDHAEWQGQIYSTNGGDYPNFYDSTGYGTGEGLCGWNCRHNFFPYLDGYSRPAYTKEELEDFESDMLMYNDKEYSRYDATQVQRGMERTVRDIKRELVAYDAILKTEVGQTVEEQVKQSFTNGSVLLKEKERALSSFTKETGLPRQREREQTYQFGISTAQKAVWANKKTRGIVQRIHQ